MWVLLVRDQSFSGAQAACWGAGGCRRMLPGEARLWPVVWLGVVLCLPKMSLACLLCRCRSSPRLWPLRGYGGCQRDYQFPVLWDTRLVVQLRKWLFILFPVCDLFAFSCGMLVCPKTLNTSRKLWIVICKYVCMNCAVACKYAECHCAVRKAVCYGLMHWDLFCVLV